MKILYINVIEQNASWGAEYFISKCFEKLGHEVSNLDYRKNRKCLAEKLLNINNFDYLVVPNHDDIKGNNVITSVGALHHLTYDKINNAKKIFDYPKNKEIVVIIIGGENKHYNFDKNTIN